MLDNYVYSLIAGVPYQVFLIFGVWVCGLDRRSNPAAYRWSTAALIVALVVLYARPWLTEPLASYMVTRDDIWQSFLHSLFDGVPIALFLVAIQRLPRSVEPAEREGETATARVAGWWRARWVRRGATVVLTVVLIVVLLIILKSTE